LGSIRASQRADSILPPGETAARSLLGLITGRSFLFFVLLGDVKLFRNQNSIKVALCNRTLGRFAFCQPVSQHRDHFKIPDDGFDFGPSYNLAPGQMVSIIHAGQS
jgi:hypothetical protein